MEVDEKDDVESESRTDEVTAFDTLASGDKDMVDLSEEIETGSKEDNHSETAEISKDLSDTVGKPESCSRTEHTFEATQTCDLDVLDSGKSIESRTEENADIEPMTVDEIAAESETRIREENGVEASNSIKISEEKAEEGRKSDSLEVSNNVSEEEDRDAAVELEITYDEKPESAVTEITGNGIPECTTDRNRNKATDSAEKLECSTSKLNDSEPCEDMDDSTIKFRHKSSCATDSDLGTVNGGVNADGSESVMAHDKITTITKPSHDKDHGESADKRERVVKLVTYSKRKSSDKKHMVDSSEEAQQKINEAVDSKTKSALDKSPSVPRDMDS